MLTDLSRRTLSPSSSSKAILFTGESCFEVWGACLASLGLLGPLSDEEGLSVVLESRGSRERRGSVGRLDGAAEFFCRRGATCPPVLVSRAGTCGAGRLDDCCRKVLSIEVTLLPPSSSSLEYQFPESPENVNNNH